MNLFFRTLWQALLKRFVIMARFLMTLFILGILLTILWNILLENHQQIIRELVYSFNLWIHSPNFLGKMELILIHKREIIFSILIFSLTLIVIVIVFSKFLQAWEKDIQETVSLLIIASVVSFLITYFIMTMELKILL